MKDNREDNKLATIDQPGGDLANSLQIDDSKLNIVKAPSLGSVLPEKFYEGAGMLELNDDQRQILAESEDCPDDDIDVRPDGLIYAGHVWYRRVLIRTFGPGGWALLPASDVVNEPGTTKIYRAWALIVRGEDLQPHYIGEAIGWADWFPNNARE